MKFPLCFNQPKVLSAAFVLLLSGCFASSDSPDVTLERANILSDRGKFNEAIEFYDKAIEAFPDRADVYYKRAVCYENLRSFDQALPDYSKCVELDPTHSDAINNKGVVLAEMQRYQEAADQFTMLINMYPDNVLALRNRGLCLHDLENYAGAIQDYDKAIELDDQDAQTWFQKGNVRLQQGQFENAIADYSNAIELDSEYAKAWMNRGVARYNLGQKQEAMAELVRARDLDDNIIIPDIDWAESAPAADVVLVAKPVFTLDSVDWLVCESFAKTYLLNQGFSDIEVDRAFPGQTCAVLKATKADQLFEVYLGFQKAGKPSAVALPAIEQPTDGAKTALLVLKLTASEGETPPELEVAKFTPEWESSAAKTKVVVVEMSL